MREEIYVLYSHWKKGDTLGADVEFVTFEWEKAVSRLNKTIRKFQNVKKDLVTRSETMFEVCDPEDGSGVKDADFAGCYITKHEIEIPFALRMEIAQAFENECLYEYICSIADDLYEDREISLYTHKHITEAASLEDAAAYFNKHKDANVAYNDQVKAAVKASLAFRELTEEEIRKAEETTGLAGYFILYSDGTEAIIEEGYDPAAIHKLLAGECAIGEEKERGL